MDEMAQEGDTVFLAPHRVVVQSMHEKNKGTKKKNVITEEEGQLGMWLNDTQQLMSYPAMETGMVDLRVKPEYVSVLFQGGEWVGEFLYQQITLSALLSLALFVGEKINEKTSSGEVFFFFFFFFLELEGEYWGVVFNV